MESENDENSSPDKNEETSSPDENDENSEKRVNFLATIPQSGCATAIPKKPVITSENNATYQPNTIIQLKQSSYSAFREMKNPRQPSDDKPGCLADDVDGSSSFAASSHTSWKEEQK